MAATGTEITVPSKLLDATLRHQVNLDRYQTSVVHSVIGLLNDADAELVAAIQKRAGVDNFTTQRLEALLDTTRHIIQETTDTLLKKTSTELAEFAQHESDWLKDVLGKMTLGAIDIVSPAAERLAAIATDKPFQGALLSEWFGKVASDKQHAVTQALRMGQVQGETVDQMTRRLTGSAKDYEAGIFTKVRNDTEAVVRTAVNHTSNTSQQMLLKQNEDIMQGWAFCATLDSRTTVICASLSGTKWPLGEGPIPPRHFRCRSFALPLLKTWRDLGIDMDEFPESTRASVGGPVKADISFSDWLKTQPEEVQNEILGKTRAQLFRDGGLTVDKFTDATGNVYSLAQLKQREAAAFEEVFPGGVHNSGGGHLGKTIPVTGPQDFSHVLAPKIEGTPVQAAIDANKAAIARGAQGAEEDVSAMLGNADPALEKKWKAYKPQIKGKLLKEAELTGAEKKILSEIPGEELQAFQAIVNDAKVKLGLSPVDLGAGSTSVAPVVPPVAPVVPQGLVWKDATDVKTAQKQFKTFGVKNFYVNGLDKYATLSAQDLLKVNQLGTELVRIQNEFPGVKDFVKKTPLKVLNVITKTEIKYEAFVDGMTQNKSALGLYWNHAKKVEVAIGHAIPENYVWKPGQWSASTGSNPLATWRHEFGHHVHIQQDYKVRLEWQKLYTKIKKDLPNILTKYSATNEKEFFAEAFSIFTEKGYVKGMLPENIEAALEKIIGKKAGTVLDEAAIKKAAEEAAALKKAAEEAAAKLLADAKAAYEKHLMTGENFTADLWKVINANPEVKTEIDTKVQEVKAQQAAFDKKWKAYKPQIKGKLVKDLPLTQAESKILGEISTEEHDALLKAVEEAKAKLIPKITEAEKASVKEILLKQMANPGVKMTEEEQVLIQKVAKYAQNDFANITTKAAEEHAAIVKAAEEAAAKKAAEEAAKQEAAKKAAEEHAANEKKLAAFDDGMQKKWKAYKPQIKGKLVNGKELTAGEKKILGEVPKHEYDDLMTKVDDALAKKGIQPKVAPPIKGTETATNKPVIQTQPTTLKIEDFQKMGGKLGSNEGGTYVNKATGEQFYIKMPATNDIAQNEIMAAQLYKMAGLDIADMQLIELGNGKWGVASKWVDGLTTDGAALKAGKLAGVYDGYGVDAWLANWDVVGLGYDNMKVLNGVKAVRVDPGGALFYRAQGGLKAFTADVTEIKTLLDASINPQSASVFKNMSVLQRDDAIRRVLRLKEADIRATVERYGHLWDDGKRKQLVDILLQRQQNIAEQFPDLVEKPVLGGRTQITKQDFWQIRNARGNGAAIRIDYNQIEDQQILFHVERLSNGGDSVVGTFKVREAGAKQLDDFIKNAAGKPFEPTRELLIKGITEEYNDSIYKYVLDTVKGVAAQSNTVDGIIRAKDIERAREAIAALDKAWDTIKAANGFVPEDWNNHYTPWASWLEKVAGALEGTPAKNFSPPGQLTKYQIPFKVIPPPEIKTDEAIQFFRRKGTYTASTIERGNIIRTSVEQSLNVGSENYFYEANLDGVRIKYWPKNDPSVAYALQGRMQVSTLEASEAAINKAIELLDRIGLNVEMPSTAQTEELYLNKIAYHVNASDYFAMLEKINNMATIEERVTAWKTYVSKVLKVPDVTKLPDYKPTGKLEIFDQGQRIFHRPDLAGEEWETFSQSYRLQHTFWSGDYVGSFDRILESGGKLLSSADRVRRGVPWGTSSAASDFRSGGADYVFTRVKAIKEQEAKAGLYWKPNNHLRRMDAISYKGDAYGHVRASAPTGWGKTPDAKLGENGFVITNRSASSPDKWAGIASSGSNETIFKGGLSIFDDIDRINIPSAQYEKVLDVFRKHGVSTWPDGRKLTDVIRKV